MKVFARSKTVKTMNVPSGLDGYTGERNNFDQDTEMDSLHDAEKKDLSQIHTSFSGALDAWITSNIESESVKKAGYDSLKHSSEIVKGVERKISGESSFGSNFTEDDDDSDFRNIVTFEDRSSSVSQSSRIDEESSFSMTQSSITLDESSSSISQSSTADDDSCSSISQSSMTVFSGNSPYQSFDSISPIQSMEEPELEDLSLAVQSSITIQSFVRMMQHRAQYQRKRQAATLIVAWFRGRRSDAQFRKVMQGVRAIQALSRMKMERKRFQQARRASTSLTLVSTKRANQSACKIQAFYRMKIERENYQRMRRAAIFVAAWMRGHWSVALLQQMRREHATVLLQSQFRGLSSRLKYQKNQDADKLESLQAELVALRAQNKDLQQKLEVNDKGGKESIQDSATTEVLSSLKTRVKVLTKANDSLLKELCKHRHEAAKAEREYREVILQTTTKVASIEDKLNNDNGLQRKYLEALKYKLKENEKRFEKERCALKQEITRARDNQSKEVTEMKEKLHSTQKAHQEYVKKIMDIFETTSAMREGEIAKLSAALRSVEQEKDNEIMILRQEVETLKVCKNSMKGTNRAALGPRTLRKQVERDIFCRERRSAQYNDIVQNLKSLVAACNALPEDMNGYSLEEIAAQQERGQKMEEMVERLNCLYKTEKDSKVKTSQEALSQIEEYVDLTEPHQTVTNLRERLATTENEASWLREYLRAQETRAREGAARRQFRDPTGQYQ